MGQHWPSAPHHQGCRLQVRHNIEKGGAGRYFCPFIRVVDCRPATREKRRGQVVIFASPSGLLTADQLQKRKGRGQVDIPAHFGSKEGEGGSFGCPPLTIRVVDCRSATIEKREGSGRYFCPFWLGRRWRASFDVPLLTIRVFDCRSVIRERGRGKVVISAHFIWEEGIAWWGSLDGRSSPTGLSIAEAEFMIV